MKIGKNVNCSKDDFSQLLTVCVYKYMYVYVAN